MIEVEKRVLIPKDKYAELLQYFNQHAELNKKFKRFTMVNIKNPDFSPNKDNPIDIRFRTTKDSGKLTVKYGNWHSSVSREEYELSFDKNEIDQLVNILRVLDYKYFIITYIHRYQYKYKGFEVTLDEYYSMDANLMEIELAVETQEEVTDAEQQIQELLEQFNLKALDSKGTVEFISKMNSIKELQVDFTKIPVKEWVEKWQSFIWCEK